MRLFRVRLRHLHEKSGLSVYKVAKLTGLSHNSVGKYVTADYVDSEYVTTAVTILAEFYGANWRDSDIVEVLTDDIEEETPLPEAV